MNSGQAQVSQADHSMIASIKGKQKTKGALAASLVGSLMSLVPGAAVRKQGFKATMQHVMDGKLGPGTRLTRIPWVSGSGPPKGFNIPVTGPGTIVSRSSGLTDPSVLEFSEATRGSLVRQHSKANGKSVPIQTPKGVRHISNAENIGAHSGTASKTANQPYGSVAGSTTTRRSSDGTPAVNLSRNSQGKLSSPDGTPIPKEGTTGVHASGEAHLTGASATRSQTDAAELTDSQSAGQQFSADTKVQPAQLNGIAGRIQISRSGDHLGNVKSQKAPDANNNRLEDMSNETIQSGKLARQLWRSHVDVKSVQNGPSTSHLHGGERSQIEGSLRDAGPEHRIINQGYVRKPLAPGLIFGQSPKAGFGNNKAKQVAKGRVVNQQGLEINHASTGLQSRLKPVPENPGSSSHLERHAAAPKAVPAQSAGRHAASSAIESGQGAGSNVINSLTDQNVSRDGMMGNDAHHRGFVKPVVVGIPEMTRNRKPMGKEISSLMDQSLLSPTQSTNEMSAALGSLARLTVSQYFRFASSGQPNGVFTFHGGSLGNVQLSFRETDSGTVLHIIVESSEIRQVIQRTLPSLERDWLQEGLEFSDVNVEVGDTGNPWEFSDTGDQTRIPIQQESAETLQVIPETIEQAIKDYGYNTLEFVA